MPKRYRLDKHECLPSDFYDRPTVEVARDLLGQILVRRTEVGDISAEIVEVEAYTADDPACHAFAGLTPRCQVMFGPPGFAYVYFIYGMYHCLNVVTEASGTPGAVLIRALRQIDDLADHKRFSGPGKICRELQIDLSFNGVALFDSNEQLFIKKGRTIEEAALEIGPRVGISKAIERPWRFFIKGDKSVSRRKP